MNKFLYYLIDSGFRFFMFLVLAWMLIHFTKWMVKVFIPATKELIRDLREWRAEERSNRAKNER